MTATLIPAHYKGIKTGASTYAESPTRHDAILLFEEAKKRLLNINQWHVLCGEGSAVFQLTNDKGQPVNRNPVKGDLVRIKLPAPPNNQGDGFDWVRIEEFENTKDLLKDQDIFGFRVRPVQNPLDNSSDPAHFYRSTATSTFLVVRTSSIVTALEKGRNETPNNGSQSIFGRIRNVAIAIAAWLGISKLQWGKLVKGIIKGPPQD